MTPEFEQDLLALAMPSIEKMTEQELEALIFKHCENSKFYNTLNNVSQAVIDKKLKDLTTEKNRIYKFLERKGELTWYQKKLVLTW